jgi:hypothetical protein
VNSANVYGKEKAMNKLIALVFVVAMYPLVFNVGAITVGPYNVTLGLQGYDDIQTTAPLKDPAAGCTIYQMDITKGNSTMPSDDVHVPEILVRILRYNIPIGIDNPANLEEYYEVVERKMFSEEMHMVRGSDFIDGHEAASWKSAQHNCQYICYFMNNNVLIELGTFDLPSNDFNILLRTFHVQGS